MEFRASHILVKDQKKAEEIAAQIIYEAQEYNKQKARDVFKLQLQQWLFCLKLKKLKSILI